MVHKIWDKDTGESEVGSIKEHLMKSYYEVYFEGLVDRRVETADGVANRLMKWVFCDFGEATPVRELIYVVTA